MTDFIPCRLCRAGNHHLCNFMNCNCFADHPNDEQIILGFKAIKRQLHPELEALVVGGWTKQPIRVKAEFGKRIDE